MMDLNSLLRDNGIDTAKARILVMRHVPKEPELRKALPWLASDEPELFNAYQRSQYPAVEKQLERADYLASFIGHQPGKAVFVGLYRVLGRRPISYKQFWKLPANIELRNLGMKGWEERGDRPHSLLFNLRLTEVLQRWKGKLIIEWPPPGRSWTRWADRNTFPVGAILDESVLDREMPDWKELVLTWEELAHLPKSWIGALSQWRGIYCIFDRADGKAYIGSAYGKQNLYGRWKNYAARGDGGNKLLRKRPPDKFLFSILERLSPDMSADDVVRREGTWKARLHTHTFGLNVN